MAFQILASDKIIKLNDFPLLGQVQNVEWNPTLNSEDVFELGIDTRIASAQELETTGSFQVLSIGGTAGLLARMITTRSGASAFTGYAFNATLASGTAASGTTTTLTTTGLTASALVGKTLYITAGANSGQSRVITANTTTVITVAPAFGSAIDNTSVFRVSGGNNAYTFTQSDLREAQFDLVMNERADQISFNRSTVLPRCYLTSIAGRADANGSANETFNFGGDFVVVAPSPYHDIRCLPATRTSSTTATLTDIAVTTSTHGLMYFYIDERRLRTTNTDPAYATLGAAGVVTITGLTIPTTASMRAIVWDNTTPSTTFPALAGSDRGTSSFFVRGYMADIFIAPASPSAPSQNEKLLRAQSIDFNVDMRVETLRQIALNTAGTAIYCRVPTYPFNITASVSTFESDWHEWTQMLDPTVKPMGGTGTDPYGETLDFTPASFKAAFAIVIKYYTKTGTLLQTWNFSDMRVQGLGDRVNVGGRAEVTWQFSGTAFTLTGVNA